MAKDKNYYLQCFSSLAVNRYHGELAPHKPILLLSLIDLYEYGVLDSMFITIRSEAILFELRNILWQYVVFIPKWLKFHMIPVLTRAH